MKLLYVTRRIRVLKYIMFKILVMMKQHSIRHCLHLYFNFRVWLWTRSATVAGVLPGTEQGAVLLLSETPLISASTSVCFAHINSVRLRTSLFFFKATIYGTTMEYLLEIKIAALVGLLCLTLLFGFIPARVKWFRDTNGTGLYTNLSICFFIKMNIAIFCCYSFLYGCLLPTDILE